jgi:uncharacterized protein
LPQQSHNNPPGIDVGQGEKLQEKEILDKYRRVAIVGVSPKPDRDSNRVIRYLNDHGYEVIPVNPTAMEVIGKTCYPDLSSVPGKVEIVDIFRKPEDVGPVVDEAIKIGASVIWMQEGIENEEAAAKAREAGMVVIMDRCIKKAHQELHPGEKFPY